MDLIFQFIAELVATVFLGENDKNNLSKRQKIALNLSCFLIILLIIKLFFFYQNISVIGLIVGTITTIGSIFSLTKLFKNNYVQYLIFLILNFVIGVLFIYFFKVSLSIEEILTFSLEPLIITTIYFLTKK